jgi:hypothetical protein
MLRRSLCAIIISLTTILFVSSDAYCHEAGDHDHIFVGINADETPGTSDDNVLFIYGVPSLIELIPTGEYYGDKQLYAAELDCWHSAEEDAHLLDLNDKTTQPGWLISLQRVNYSDPINFWMEDESTTLEILTSNGSTYAFDAPSWDDEEGWYFHNHTEFLALASGAGETFTATFKLLDNGTTDFADSANYMLTFTTVPEPTTITLFGAGLISILRLRRK